MLQPTLEFDKQNKVEFSLIINKSGSIIILGYKKNGLKDSIQFIKHPEALGEGKNDKVIPKRGLF